MKWELANSTDQDYIFELARTMGWLENKVQVRRIPGFDVTWYAIEYYDNCECPNIIPPFVDMGAKKRYDQMERKREVYLET